MASLSGPQLVTEGGDWTGVPAWGVWRESEDGKLWAPSPTPAFSGTWLGQASTSGNRNLSLKRVIFIRQQLCLQNTFPYVCFQPREDGWGRVINPDLQMEKRSSNLGFGSKILGAGASAGLKVGAKETFKGKAKPRRGD